MFVPLPCLYLPYLSSLSSLSPVQSVRISCGPMTAWPPPSLHHPPAPCTLHPPTGGSAGAFLQEPPTTTTTTTTLLQYYTTTLHSTCTTRLPQGLVLIRAHVRGSCRTGPPPSPRPGQTDQTAQNDQNDQNDHRSTFQNPQNTCTLLHPQTLTDATTTCCGVSTASSPHLFPSSPLPLSECYSTLPYSTLPCTAASLLHSRSPSSEPEVAQTWLYTSRSGSGV
ncbi:hypothetical protein BKA65DRAFT_584988 [Rhexocercosporidium sp. MPI-PUGE-AT-0058]|nr:hypothetical protein BKA65DRAFT_584988 [Rhexocercosporidium sp. MPI-PUGE-AT-0058]